MLETEVERRIVHDGTRYHIEILGKQIGPKMRTQETATDILNWINADGLQDLIRVVADIIEKAFTEKEIANGNK